MPQQLEQEPNNRELARIIRQKNAMDAYMQVRQRIGIQRDLLSNLKSSPGDFSIGESIWYWNRDLAKIRGGEWLKGKVLQYEPNRPDGAHILQGLQQER